MRTFKQLSTLAIIMMGMGVEVSSSPISFDPGVVFFSNTGVVVVVIQDMPKAESKSHARRRLIISR